MIDGDVVEIIERIIRGFLRMSLNNRGKIEKILFDILRYAMLMNK